ncbi:serpin-ZX-like [Silene latifolia]|uniref:serpin-ZX-like n=1 Tax=Silene latifolia TaxID=37657 RepID=UPI003D7869E6
MSRQPLIPRQNDVFMKLAHQVSSTIAKEHNLVFSPLSLHVVLSLIAAGSSGVTLDELLEFLKSETIDDLNKLSSIIASNVVADGSSLGGPELQFANGVWVSMDLPLKPSFVDVVHGVYKAVVKNVDFVNQARKVTSEVNSWAENHTKGLIKEVLPKHVITVETKLILANALYFKGSWDIKFDATKTKSFDFHLLNGDSIQVPFMRSYEKQFVRSFGDFKVLRLLYKQGKDINRQFSMYVFLPNEIDGLPSLMEKFSSQPGFLEEHLPSDKKVLMWDFKLPKFKISFGFEATDVLKSLGVEHPFIPGGLTEMLVDPFTSDELYVSNIFQKSFIEVNEEGTEAAAVTVANLVIPTSCSNMPQTFVADHPFMFMIREDISGVVLFIGHVMDPSS